MMGDRGGTWLLSEALELLDDGVALDGRWNDAVAATFRKVPVALPGYTNLWAWEWLPGLT